MIRLYYVQKVSTPFLSVVLLNGVKNYFNLMVELNVFRVCIVNHNYSYETNLADMQCFMFDLCNFDSLISHKIINNKIIC